MKLIAFSTIIAPALAAQCQCQNGVAKTNCAVEGQTSCKSCSDGWQKKWNANSKKNYCKWVGKTTATLQIASVAEGHWHTKAITVTNTGCEPVDIKDYKLEFFMNGGKDSGKPNWTYQFKGQFLPSLAPGGSMTICHKNCETAVMTEWRRKIADPSLFTEEDEKFLAKKGKAVAAALAQSVTAAAVQYVANLDKTCQDDFQDKCTEVDADFSWKSLINGDDTMKLMHHPRNGALGNKNTWYEVDEFISSEDEGKTCWQDDAGMWSCVKNVLKKDATTEFPYSRLASSTECSCACGSGVAAQTCNNPGTVDCTWCNDERFVLVDHPSNNGRKMCQYLAKQNLKDWEADSSQKFHISMFSERCNPKKCPEWECEDWCRCFRDNNVHNMFNSFQYKEALDEICPPEGEPCDCSEEEEVTQVIVDPECLTKLEDFPSFNGVRYVPTSLGMRMEQVHGNENCMNGCLVTLDDGMAVCYKNLQKDQFNSASARCDAIGSSHSKYTYCPAPAAIEN
jgi:hypothetical protein